MCGSARSQVHFTDGCHAKRLQKLIWTPYMKVGLLITAASVRQHPRRNVLQLSPRLKRLIISSHGGEYDVQSCLLGYTVFRDDP
jgi:hypothetical protein